MVNCAISYGRLVKRFIDLAKRSAREDSLIIMDGPQPLSLGGRKEGEGGVKMWHFSDIIL